jgi:hypothetical protein
MNSNPKIFNIMVAIYFLSSCSTNPVGWGGRFNVLNANDKLITIEYDKMTSSFDEIFEVARSHCSKFGKVAIPVDKENLSSAKGLIPTHTFRCE